jgi:cAMP-dependent protein kinase regulator
MSTFQTLVADLTRDYQRVQPRDTLQFCASFFFARLAEQREQLRDTMNRQSSFSHDIPAAFYTDMTMGAVDPLSRATPQARRSIAAPSPFGALDVPGNALLSGGYDQPSSGAPLFSINTDDQDAFSNNSPFTNPFGGGSPFENASPFGAPNGSPGPGDFLHPPSSMIYQRRTSVSAESIDPDDIPEEPLPVFPKSDDHNSRIRASISNNFIFRDLDEMQEKGVIGAMQERQVAKDEVIILQGDVGEFFYVVESGHFHCYIHPDPLPPSWLDEAQSPEKTPPTKFLQPDYHPRYGKKVADCPSGSSFGELALMYGHPRAATVIAIEPSTVWSLDRMTFRTIILKAAHKRRTMYEQFLSSVPLLTSLEPGERSKIADALVSRVYADGEDVVRQGDMGDKFFFVEDGEAVVIKDGVQVGTLKKGEYFGGESVPGLYNTQPC